MALAMTGVLGVALLLRVTGLAEVPWLINLLIVAESLLIEAVPFVLLGAAVSAGIEVFVPSSAFERLGRLPHALQLPAAGVAGMAFPVCECGSVPVARRLAQKGLSAGAAVTFMLAAPVINPVVIASTWVAYRGQDTLWVMVFGRLLLGLVVAICVGWVIGAMSKDALLKPRPDEAARGEVDELGDDSSGLHGHDHDHDHEGNDADTDGRHGTQGESRTRRFLGHLAGDFVFMGRYLILGAFIAAALQTFIPQSILASVANLPIISLLAMMALAFLLSLCSESDAFVAASFVQFGVASQLAFLVFGPMMDLKLGALYAGTFSKGFVRIIAVGVTVTTLAATLWVQVVFG